MISSILNIFSRSKSSSRKGLILVVSGLPRSGTSMMMKMLEAGGIPVLADGERIADDDNPKGYYEFERVKKLKDGDTAWMSEARGKVVKVISALLEYMPMEFQYKVLFMQRDIGEILASQKQMLIRRGEATDKVSDDEMKLLYEKHLGEIEFWLASQPNIETLFLSYNQILEDPLPYVEQIDQFHEKILHKESMLAVIDNALYRQKNNQ